MSEGAHTLAGLHPSHLQDLHMMKTKTSQRLQGSYQMSLLRPHRIPETSRKYIHGDPVAMIDWKAFARSDQLIVRERRDEASAYVRIGVDQSETMSFCGALSNGVRKQEIALRIALNLGHIHLEMGDLVELWILQEDIPWPLQRYRPRSPADVVGLYEYLVQQQFSSESLPTRQAKPGDQVVDQVYWVGDLLGQADAIGFLKTGKQRCLFHVMHTDELDVSWLNRKDCYFDKSTYLKEFTGDALRKSYDDQILEWRSGWQQKLADERCLYTCFTEGTNITDYFRFLETLPQRMI